MIFLDIMLPGTDGRKVLKRLRATGKEMPVLFPTAKDTIEDRVADCGWVWTTILLSRLRSKN